MSCRMHGEQHCAGAEGCVCKFHVRDAWLEDSEMLELDAFAGCLYDSGGCLSGCEDS